MKEEGITKWGKVVSARSSSIGNPKYIISQTALPNHQKKGERKFHSIYSTIIVFTEGREKTTENHH